MRSRSTKLIIVTPLAVVAAAIVAGTASAGGTSPTETQQPAPSAPSDSAAFPGGGTVSVQGVNYPKGTVAPRVGTRESGPTVRHVGVVYAAPSSNEDGFDWADAAVGLAIGIGVASVAALFFVGMRRSKATPVAA
jgi:hypothetical protein